MSKQEVIERMCQSGVLPVFRTTDVTHLLPASRAFYDAGIGCIEYTLTMPDPLQLIRSAVAALPSDQFVGAGTVMNERHAEQAIEAGARFIAGPGLKPEVVKVCSRLGVVCVAGAITPTEIMLALDLGADVIKVFPACAVGPGFFAEVLGPFPAACLMAAGGITAGNVKEYVRAGAKIVTFLANGIDARAYAAGDVQRITQAAAAFVRIVQSARGDAGTS